MARINTNVSALIANTNLAKSQASLSKSIQRLSSGLKINSGADDPSGLIISQQLQAEIGGISAAIDNSTQASNVISTTDAALSEVSNLLVSIKGLVVQAANTGAESSDEIQANQLQVNSAINSITRIANSTSFAGTKLLDGSLGYISSGIVASAVHDVSITSVAFGTQKTLPVVVNVIASAQPAELLFNASSITTSINLNVAGAQGTQQYSFISGTKASAIAFKINQSSDSTGVTANINNLANLASGISFTSTSFGAAQFISVVGTAVGATSNFATTNLAGSSVERETGRDAVATINGSSATAAGLSLSLNTAGLSLSLNLDRAFGVGTETFTITGGGVTFQLGSSVQSNEQVGIGIGSVSANNLGSALTGYLSDLLQGGSAALATDPGKASSIIDAAINQVSVLRGRLGAFESNTLQTNINSLQVALENVTSSNSSITDTNFAAETSNLTRQQILVQAGTSVLAQANSTPQSVLKLLS